MPDVPLPREVYDITEKDFWSHLAVPEGAPGADALAEAVRLGLAGRKRRAYAALAQLHLAAREQSWEMAREEAKAARAISPAAVRRMASQPLSALAGADDGSDTIRDLSALFSRLDPVVARAVSLGADKPTRALLDKALVGIYRQRRSLNSVGPYPLNCQLGAHGQFVFFWRAYLALIHSGPIPTVAAEAAMKLLMGLGRAMHAKSERYIVHNIYTAGCYGLFFTARTMQEFREAAAWERRALDSLGLDWVRSWFPDGGHAERNWGYGSHTLARQTHTWRFAIRTGGMGGREERFLAGLRRAYRFYAATLDGKNISPGFGDEGLGNWNSVLQAALESGVFPPGTPRDLGVDRSRSVLMPDSGVAIMRGGAGAQDTWSDVTFGEYAGWHSHMDLLSMDLRAHGSVLLQEAPRFGPYEHPMDVLWRGPEAHNQLLVDTFTYDSRPCQGEDVLWHSDEAVDVFSAFHKAYRLVDPMGHRTHHSSADLVVRRTIVFVKDPGYALVMDSVRAEASDAFNRATSCWWHAPRPFRVLGPGMARTTGSPGCLLAWARPETVRRLETGTDYTAEEGGASHASLSGQCHNLRARTWMPDGHDGCLGFATLLLPFRGKPPEASVRPLKLKGAVPHRAEGFQVSLPQRKDVFVLNPERLRGISFRGEPIRSRAQIKLSGRREAIRIA